MNLRGLVASLLGLGVIALALNGCATGDVAAGYNTAYFAPDYQPYYGAYGYDGLPYWGDGPYVDAAVIVGGREHRGYFGGHHFAHDWGSFRGAGGARGLGGHMGAPPPPPPPPAGGGRGGR